MNTATTATRMEDLRTGGVVLNQGLLLELGEGIQRARNGQTVYAYPGRILNPEFLATEEGSWMYRGLIPLDGSEDWTVQSIGSVAWHRVN